MSLISIVVPCFNEEEAIPIFYNEMLKISKNMGVDFEILFVNDGSTDTTLEVIKNLSSNDNQIKYISFSRNFGKEAAIYAGLKNSMGDYVVVMDVDLQDPPELLPEMYSYIMQDDYDCVATRRVTRKGEPPIRSFFARLFYKIINIISDTEIVDGARDYRFMTRQMVDAILDLPEYNRFSKGIFSWVGFRTKWLEYENIERSAGETYWSFWKLFKYSLEGIIAFSTAPLAISSIMGLVCCILAFIVIMFLIFRTLLFGDPVAGWPSLSCLILFMGGLQLFSVGILGQYLAKTYMETKQRPLYISKEDNLKK